MPRVGDRDFVHVGVSQAALLLGVSVSTLKIAIRCGEPSLPNGLPTPPSYRSGANRTTYMFLLHELVAIIDGNAR